MHAASGSDYISYELYKPASVTPGAGCAYSAVWGSGATNGLVPTAATTKNARTYNVCGRTALGQDVGADSYSDSVTATVNF
jgi:spore coat protein U-like protein